MGLADLGHFLLNWVEEAHKAASVKGTAAPDDTPPDSEDDTDD